MEDERLLSVSELNDVNNINLEDYVNDELIKIYPYTTVNDSKFVALADARTTTIVRIWQGESAFSHLESEDVNGKKVKFLKILTAVDNRTETRVGQGINAWKKNARNIKDFTAITNDLIEAEGDKIIFYTIGEPFNEEKYKKGDQKIYYGSDFIKTLPEVEEEFVNEYQIESTGRVSQVTLMDISTLTDNYELSTIYFTEKIISTNNLVNMKIKVMPEMVIGNVRGKGTLLSGDEEEFIDIDFEAAADHLNWFNMTPIGVKDKLTVITPWLDENVTMNKIEAEHILNNNNNNMKLSEFALQFSISDSLKNLVLDIVLFSYMYANSFAEIPRTPTGSLAPLYRLGTGQAYVAGIANVNPLQVIDGLYRTWRKIHPTEVGSDGEIKVKGFINALSSFVQTSLATAKGENDFNNNILPWRVVLSKELKLTNKESGNSNSSNDDINQRTGWFVLDDFEFKLDFKPNGTNPYFKIHDGLINGQAKKVIGSLSNISLSEEKLIESERKITMPELPEIIQEIDKLSNPGDISTTSNKDLKYMVKLPLDTDEFNKLMTGDGAAYGLKTITFKGPPLAEKIHAYTESEADALIRKEITNLYSDASNIKVLVKGETSKINDVRYSQGGSFASSKSGWFVFSREIIKTIPTVSEATDFNKWMLNVLTTGLGTDLSYAGLVVANSLNRQLSATQLRDVITNYNILRGENPGLRDINNLLRYVMIHIEGNFQGWFASYEEDNRPTNDSYKALFRCLLKTYYNVDDIHDIVVDIFNLSDYQSHRDVRYFSNFSYTFHIKRYTWVKYEYSFDTTLPSSELVRREFIYDRPKWKNLIKTVIDVNNGIYRNITLTKKWNQGVYNLKELSISSLFGDKIYLVFDSGEIEINLTQRYDESISTHKIVFY